MVSAIAEDEHTGAAIIAPHEPYALPAPIARRLSIRASHFPGPSPHRRVIRGGCRPPLCQEHRRR